MGGKMDTKTKASLVGFGLIGVGCGLAVIGVAIVVPAGAAWSREWLEAAFRKGKESMMSGVQSAAATVGEVAGRAQQTFDEAARAARKHTVQ
jgi:hypothetical protein